MDLFNKIVANKNLVLVFKVLISYRLFTLLFFAGFIWYSIIDANARILITDPALYLFKIINNKGFEIPAERYTSLINQFFVVISVKMNMPLSFLIPVYSASFVFIRFLYFLLAEFVFKNRAAGFAIIVFSILGVAESYFRPTSESTIAMLNSILLFAFLFYSDKREWGKWKVPLQLTVTFLLVVFGFFTHPIALFSLLFVIVYFSLASFKLKTLYPYLAVFFTLLLFLWKVFFADNGGHHNSLFGNLITSPFNILKEIPTYYPYKFFLNFFEMLYRPVFLLFGVAGLLLLLIRKRHLAGLFVIVYIPLYFVIACTSFKEGDTNMQMEKIFLPAIMFLALALSDGFLYLYKKDQILHIATVVWITYIGFANIEKVRPIYQGRVDYVREIVTKANLNSSRKLIIKSEQLDRKIIFSWALGIETLMLSSLDSEIQPLTVYCLHGTEKLEGKRDKPDNFIVAPFQTSYDYSRLNPVYFKLPEQEYNTWNVDLK